MPDPPSYLINNPMVDILKQRGKEQGQLYLPAPTPSKTSQKPIEKPRKQPTTTQKSSIDPPFEIGPLDTRKKLTRKNKELLKALLTGKITVQEANSASLILRNQISLVCPPKPVEVTQRTTISLDQKKLVEELEEDEQAVLARAIKRLESSPSQL